MEDRELAEKIEKGDTDAFRRLFESYKDLVYSISLRISGSREEAEDITQDVFIRIFDSIGKFRWEAKLSSWFYRITVNTCLKRERRRRLEKLVSLESLFGEEEDLLPASEEETPDRQVEQVETGRIVRQAIRRLPARQRTAIVLQRYEALSYEEIAQAMAISLYAVESLIHRAKENLARELLPLKKDLR